MAVQFSPTPAPEKFESRACRYAARHVALLTMTTLPMTANGIQPCGEPGDLSRSARPARSGTFPKAR